VFLLLNLQHVTKQGGFDNPTTMLVNSTTTFGGLYDVDLASKLICFGVDRVMILQGLKIEELSLSLSQ
jgi:hypothetical protein